MGRYIHSVVGTFATITGGNLNERVVTGLATLKASLKDAVQLLLMRLGRRPQGRLCPAWSPASPRARANSQRF
jgi:hypothetical protein